MVSVTAGQRGKLKVDVAEAGEGPRQISTRKFVWVSVINCRVPVVYARLHLSVQPKRDFGPEQIKFLWRSNNQMLVALVPAAASNADGYGS